MTARIFAVLVTFNRPRELRQTVDRMAGQTRSPDLLVIIDNGGASDVDPVLNGYRNQGFEAHCITPGENLGPAGGFAIGMEFVLTMANDEDWIMLLDDDDPPFFEDAVENAARFAQESLASDTNTGGVGISGGRFNRRTGRVVRIGDAQIHGPVRVDHITGGGLPMYRVEVVREVGVYLRNLFFGFEELEYGLRLTDRGYVLYADGQQWQIRKAVKRSQGLLPPEHESEKRASRGSLGVATASWRRYYSLRNLIYILRRIDKGTTAVGVALIRGFLKPLLNLPFHPGGAWDNLRLNRRAIRDGWSGRMGRTVEPTSSEFPQ